MIYVDVIWEAISPKVWTALIGVGALLCTLSLFLPKNTKLYKFIRFLTKSKK